MQYLHESWSAVPPLPSNCVVTLGEGTTQLLDSSGTPKIVILLCSESYRARFINPISSSMYGMVTPFAQLP